MKDKEFQCSVCGGIFEKGWTEEEARAEQKRNGWEDLTVEMVCNDCYKMMGFASND